MEVTHINKIQGLSRPPFAVVVAQNHFLYKISKHEYFNGKNICLTELLEL